MRINRALQFLAVWIVTGGLASLAMAYFTHDTYTAGLIVGIGVGVAGGYVFDLVGWLMARKYARGLMEIDQACNGAFGRFSFMPLEDQKARLKQVEILREDYDDQDDEEKTRRLIEVNRLLCEPTPAAELAEHLKDPVSEDPAIQRVWKFGRL